LPPLTLLPGQRPAHDARCAAAGKAPTSTPSSAMVASAARLPTPGGGVQPVARLSERGNHRIDPLVELADGAFQVLEVLQRQPD